LGIPLLDGELAWVVVEVGIMSKLHMPSKCPLPHMV
jgi:hypothetical protein